MKKVQSILYAIIFMMATTGLGFAQPGPASPPAQLNEVAPADKAAEKFGAADKSYPKKRVHKHGRKNSWKKLHKKAWPKKVAKKRNRADHSDQNR